ncbi:MAG TPA: C39 family peptidase [Polyangiaceae bacterium]|nr:C39 family peptidase [Polyangiaceae bacterium]
MAKQQRNFSCGAAATLNILRYWCVEGFARAEESSLYDALRTTQARGTEPEAIAAFLGAQGLEASYRNEDIAVADLERAVDAHEPPIVDLQAWSDHPAPWSETWDAGHYVVMVGYDAERLFFGDPGNLTPGAYAFLGRAEMEDRWHDLAGDNDAPVRRMAVFVRGTRRWTPPEPPPAHATGLG